MCSQHEKAARLQPGLQLVRDPALQCLVEIRKGEVSAQDQIEGAGGHRLPHILQSELDSSVKLFPEAKHRRPRGESLLDPLPRQIL